MTQPVIWLAAAGVAALALMVAVSLAPYARIPKRERGLGMLLLILIATLYGGTKPPGASPHIRYDNYLTVHGHYLIATNVVGATTNYNYNGLSVAWILSDADLINIIPQGSPVYVEATEDAGTNYIQIGASTLGALGWEGEFDNATNYHYFVWLDWSLTPSIATNGVYHLNLSQPVPNRYVPLRIKVDVDGETITPTPEDGL